MADRGYQENFYTLYPYLRKHKTPINKAKKVVAMLQMYSGVALDQFICLDIGCSSGVITSFAAPYFKGMIGLEYDPVGLELVTGEQKKQSLFMRGDAMTLPFPDGSVDAIICAQVYEHVPDDLKLFEEMDRILRPGGLVFFSGPNKVFPVEPHYYLPFLHWLPEKLSDAYLKILGKGNHFYERSRTMWGLRKIFSNFDIYDVTIPVVRFFAAGETGFRRIIYQSITKVPRMIWLVVLPLVPNFNWVLRKKVLPGGKNVYQVKT